MRECVSALYTTHTQRALAAAGEKAKRVRQCVKALPAEYGGEPMTDQLDSLLGAMLSAPRLDGALCVGRHELFDLAEPDTTAVAADERQSTALALCAQCPALDACTTWLDSLPKAKRPYGVVAGRIVKPTRPRKRAA